MALVAPRPSVLDGAPYTACGLPNALRITIGSDEVNEATIAGLRDFLGGKNP